MSNYPDFFKLCNNWTDFFYSSEMEKTIIPILKELNQDEEKKYYPESENIFRCFYMTAYDNIKVVIIGQEPYDNGSASGLCFDIKLGFPLNHSLQNIYKELDSEGFYPIKDGNLESWTKQGVFLLNTSLTVRPSEQESHCELWRHFSEKIIEKLSEKNFIVWILLGKKASDWKEFITNKNHVIFEATHPSPYSALKSTSTQPAFIGSNIFKNTNKELYNREINKIVW